MNIKAIESHVVGIASGIAIIVAAFIEQWNATNKLGFGAIGGVVLAASVVAGAVKNKSVSVASIQNAGSQVATELHSALPILTSVDAFVTQEWPSSKDAITNLVDRVSSLEKSHGVVDVAAIAEQAAGIIQSKIAAATTPTPPAGVA